MRGGQGIKGALNPINYVARMIRTGGMESFYSEPELFRQAIERQTYSKII